MTGTRFRDRPRWQRWLIITPFAVFGLLVALVAIGAATMTPEQRAKIAREREAATAAKAASAKASNDAALAVLRGKVEAVSAPCDAGQAAVGIGLADLAAADKIALARSVRVMQTGCKSAWLALKDVEAPEGLTDAQEDAFGPMIEACRLALYSRAELAEQLMPIADGDLRPSTITAIEEEMALMKSQQAACTAALDALAPQPASTK